MIVFNDDTTSIEGVLARLLFLDDFPEYQDKAREDFGIRSFDNFGLYVVCGIVMFIILRLLQRKYLSWSKITFGKGAHNKEITYRDLYRQRTCLGRFIAIYCNIRKRLQNTLPKIVIQLLLWESSVVNRKIQTSLSVKNTADRTNLSQGPPSSKHSLQTLSHIKSSFSSKDQTAGKPTDSSRSVKEVKPSKILDKSTTCEGLLRKTNIDVDHSHTLKGEEQSLSLQNPEKRCLNTEHHVKRHNQRQTPTITKSSLTSTLLPTDNNAVVHPIHPPQKQQALSQGIGNIGPHKQQALSQGIGNIGPHKQQALSQGIGNTGPKKQLDSNMRSESMSDEKLPVLLTYPSSSSTLNVENPKMRSMFSRSKSRKRCISSLSQTYSLLSQEALEDNTSAVNIHSLPKQDDKTISDPLPEISAISVQKTDMSLQKSDMSLQKSDTSLQKTEISKQLADTIVKTLEMSRNKSEMPEKIKSQTMHDGFVKISEMAYKIPKQPVKGSGKRVKIVDVTKKMPEMLTKMSHTQVDATIPAPKTAIEKTADAHVTSEKKPNYEHSKATRKRKTMTGTDMSGSKKNDQLSARDFSKSQRRYQKSVGRASISAGTVKKEVPANVYEVFASKNGEKLTKHTKLTEESFEIWPLRNQQNITSIKNQKGSMLTNMLEFVDIALEQTKCQKRHDPMKTTVTKAILNSAGKKNAIPDPEDNEIIRPNEKREHIMRPNIKETNLRPSITDSIMNSSIKEIEIRPNNIDSIIRPNTKENYQTSVIPADYSRHDIKKHGKQDSQMPLLNAQAVRQAKTLTPWEKQKSRNETINQRSESIRMVESLISLSVANPTDNSATLAVMGSSLSQSLNPKEEQSINFSFTISEADNKVNLNATASPNLVSTDPLRISQETGDLRDAKDAKKNLRSATKTEISHKSERQSVNLAMPSPTAWSTFNKAMKSVTENQGIDSKISKVRNIPNPDGKRILSPIDYPMLFDKLIRKSKNNIRNTLLLCKTAKTTMYEQLNLMKPQGPGSVRASKIRSRTGQFPTLMSFLDHIEKEDRERSKRLKHGQIKQEGVSNEVKTESPAPKDGIVKKLDSASTDKDRSETRKTGIKHVSKEIAQKRSTSNLSFQTFQKALLKPEQKHVTILNDLHFGTEKLELYSGSYESISCQNEVSVLNQGSAYAKTKFAKRERNIPTPKSRRMLQKSITGTNIIAIPKKETKADYRVWKKDALMNMKKDLKEKIDNRDSKGSNIVATSFSDSIKSGAEKQHKKPWHRLNPRKFAAKSNHKMKLEIPPSLFAFPGPSMGSEHASVENTGSDKVQASTDMASVTDGKKKVSKQTPTSSVHDAGKRRKLTGSFEHKPKISQPQNTFKLLSPAKSNDVTENIRHNILNLPSKTDKISKRRNKTLDSSGRTKLLELSDENLRKSPCQNRSVSNTPKQSKKIEASKRGDISIKSSIAALNKLAKDDRSRDTDISSTSKSFTFTDIVVTPKAHSIIIGPATAGKLSKNMIKCDPDTTSRSEIQTSKLADISLKTSSSNLKGRLLTSRRRGVLSPQKQYARDIIRNEKAKDICDRYLVHTAENPHMRKVAQSRKKIGKTKNIEGELHGSSTDIETPAKSPAVTDSQTKPEVWQQSFLSYTSKHRASDISCKSVKSPWRGTVAFRKRLQHLIQHNKDLQNKNTEPTMQPQAVRKSKCVQVSPRRLNSLRSKRDNLLNLYKAVTIGKVNKTVTQEVEKIMSGNLLLAKREQVKSIQWAGESSSPVSNDLIKQDNFVQTTVSGRDHEYAAPPVVSPMKNNRPVEEAEIEHKVISPVESGHYQGSETPTKTITESSKPILTHSDVFEQKQLIKKRKDKTDQKLKRTRCIKEIIPITSDPQIGAPCKSSNDSAVEYHKSNLPPCTLMNQKVYNIRSNLSWPQRDTDTLKEKQLGTRARAKGVIRNKRNNLTVKREHRKTVSGSLIIKHPIHQYKSSSDRALSEKMTPMWRKHSCVDILNQGSSTAVDNNTDATAKSFSQNRKDIAKTPEETEANMRNIQSENNLQQLLDKIKQSCFLALTAKKDKSKENASSVSASKEKSDPQLNLKNSLHDVCPKLTLSDTEKPSDPRKMLDDVSHATEQTRSICTADPAALGDSSPTLHKDKSPQSTVAKDAPKVNMETSASHGAESDVTNMILKVDVKQVRGEKHATDQQGEMRLNMTSKDSCTIATYAKDNKSVVTFECCSTDVIAKIPKTKPLRSKSPKTPTVFQNIGNIKSIGGLTSPAEVKDKIVASNVKHVAFDLNNDYVQHESMIADLSHSEIISQDSSQVNSDLDYARSTDDDTEVLPVHAMLNLPGHNHGTQTMSLITTLQTDEKNNSLLDTQTDESSDTSHIMELQQSATSEAMCKVPSSSEYGTLEIVSPTSLSKLQSSFNLEPGKLTPDYVKGREVVTPNEQRNTEENVREHILLHSLINDQARRECFERFSPSSVQAASFWKKDMHMDVIPEEADYESGLDTYTDMNSAANKPSDEETNCHDVEHSDVKRGSDESLIADKLCSESVNQVDIEKNKKEKEQECFVKAEVDMKNEDAENPPYSTTEVDETVIEVSGDEGKSSLHTSKDRTSTTSAFATGTSATEYGKSSINSQNVFEDQIWNPADDPNDASALSQLKDHGPSKNINPDVKESPDVQNTVIDTFSENKRKDKDSTLTDMNELMSDQDPWEHKVYLTSKPNIQDAIVQTSENTHGTARDGTHSDEAELSQQKDSEQKDTALNNVGTILSSSFSRETGGKESRVCCVRADSISPTRPAEINNFQSTSGIDTSTPRLQKTTIYFLTEIDASKQSELVHDKNKHDVSYSPKKPAFFEIRGSLRSHDFHSPNSSGNAQLEATASSLNQFAIEQTCKPHELANIRLNHANKEGIIQCYPNDIQENSNSHKQQSLLSQFKKSDSEEERTSKKYLQRTRKGNQKTSKTHSVSPCETNLENLSPCSKNIPCESKTGKKIRKFGSDGSESSAKSSIRTVSECTKVAHTQKSREHDDFSKVRKLMGQPIESARDGKTVQTTPQSAPPGTCKNSELFVEMASLHPSSRTDESMSDKVKLKYSSTRKVSCSGGKSEAGKADQKAKQTGGQSLQQDIHVKRERYSTSIATNKILSPTGKDSRRKTEPEERNIKNVSDDLESLLNKELSQASIVGGLRTGYKSRRLFGTHSDRVVRRWKRQRLADKSSNQLSNQRELQFQFLRENDGSLKGISSNTSQSTVFSPSEVTMHHSSRPIRPLAPGRFTKLEEFLQKAEQSNRTDSASNVSRAVSKLSSFTSVTPSSQEEEQLQPLQHRTDHRWKAYNFKHCTSEPSDQRSCTPTKASPRTVISTKSLRLNRVQYSKSKQWQHVTVPEVQPIENNKKYVSKTRGCKRNTFSWSPTCQSDCSRNNDSMGVKSDDSELSTPKKHTESCMHERKIIAFDLSETAEKNLEVCENTQQIRPIVGIVHSPKRLKHENLVESSMPKSDVIDSSKPPNKSTFSECLESTMSSANVGMSQRTEESSSVSTSSSSIVLSWIGSDLADAEETVHITPNLSDHYGKMYSHVSTQQNKSQLGTPLNEGEKNLMLINPCAINNQPQFEESECLSQEMFSMETSKLWEAAPSDLRSSVSGHVTLKEPNGNSTMGTKGIPARSSQKEDVKKSSDNDLNKLSLSEDVADSWVASQNENKDNWLTRMSASENSYDCHKKQFKCNHFVPSSCYKCPHCEPNLSPESSKQTQKQFYIWSDRAREYTLEQPSYFNALLRDPKWNPSFDVKEDRYIVDQHPELLSSGRNYVQSAWTYQNMRNTSPSNTSQQKEQQDGRSTLQPQYPKENHLAHTQTTKHTASTTHAPRSYIDSQPEDYSFQSSVTDPHFSRNSKTKLPEDNIEITYSLRGPSFRHNKQPKQSEDVHVTFSHSRVRSEEKQSSLSRKVHFDNNPRASDKSPSNKHINLPLTLCREPKEVSKERISLDEHLKSSSKSGMIHSKDRFSKQQSKGTDSTRTRTKVSLEQHLCSTLDTDNNLTTRSNAAEPTSENGTTKSSSHASLNWYKPQSLPSSTSVSNSNATPHQQDIPRLSRAPLSEPDTTSACRQTNIESTRRQNAQEATPCTSPDRNLALSSPGNNHGMVNNQRNTTFAHGTHRSSLIQTLTLNFAPDLERGSSENLSTSSASVHGTDRRHILGFRRLRESAARGSTRQTLPPSPSGHSSRGTGSKSTRGLNSASDNSRSEHKPLTTNEATVQRGSSYNSGKSSGNLSYKRSSNSTQSISQKKSDATSTRTSATISQEAPWNAQFLKRTRTAADSSTSQTQVHTTGDNSSRDAKTVGTRQKLRQSWKSSRDSHVSEPFNVIDEDPVGSSAIKSTKRVSRLVEMFEKKCES